MQGLTRALATLVITLAASSASAQFLRDVIEGPAIVGAPTPVGPLGGMVSVRVIALRPTDLHVRVYHHDVTAFGATRVVDDFRLVCAPAPCSGEVPAGFHLFALSAPGGAPLPAHELRLEPWRAYTLEIDLDDRSAVRTLGTTLALIVGIPGLLLLVVSAIVPAFDHQPIDVGFAAVGASMTAVGVAALPLAAWGDTRRVELLDADEATAPR